MSNPTPADLIRAKANLTAWDEIINGDEFTVVETPGGQLIDTAKKAIAALRSGVEFDSDVAQVHADRLAVEEMIEGFVGTTNHKYRRNKTVRLNAVADSGHAFALDYSNFNKPIIGSANGHNASWTRVTATAGKLEVAFPDLVTWGDSHAYYATQLWKNNYQAVMQYNMVQAGVGGEPASAILARFATDVLAKNPAALLISAGTNSFNTAENEQAQALDDCKEIVRQAKTTGAYIFYYLPGPADASWASLFPQDRLLLMKDFSIAMEAFLDDADVPYINVGRLLCTDYDNDDFTYKDSTMTFDGIHHSLSGELAIMFELLARYDVPATLKTIILYAFLNSQSPAVSSAPPQVMDIEFGGYVGTRRYNSARGFAVQSYEVPKAIGNLGLTLTGGKQGFKLNPISSVGATTYVYLCGGVGVYTSDFPVVSCRPIKALCSVGPAADQLIPFNTRTQLALSTTIANTDANALDPNTDAVQVLYDGTYTAETTVMLEADQGVDVVVALCLQKNSGTLLSSSSAKIAAGEGVVLTASCTVGMAAGEYLSAQIIITAASGGVTAKKDSAFFTGGIDGVLAHLTVTRLDES